MEDKTQLVIPVCVQLSRNQTRVQCLHVATVRRVPWTRPTISDTDVTACTDSKAPTVNCQLQRSLLLTVHIRCIENRMLIQIKQPLYAGKMRPIIMFQQDRFRSCESVPCLLRPTQNVTILVHFVFNKLSLIIVVCQITCRSYLVSIIGD